MATHFDYLCIGGGSGGIASANRAAMYGAKVALIEAKDLGGTCVNVGCVPKKVMWHGAQIAEAMHLYAEDYGFDVDVKTSTGKAGGKPSSLHWPHPSILRSCSGQQQSSRD